VHIGVDLDNTVLDASSSHLKYYNIASGLTLTPDDVDDFFLYRLYGWDRSKAGAIYREYGNQIHWESVPYPMAVGILQQLYEQHQISIITSRPMNFRDVTERWLVHYKIYYYRIVFTVNKFQECVSSNVDVLIDDGPHYAEQFVREGKPVVLYEQPYNVCIYGYSVYNHYGSSSLGSLFRLRGRVCNIRHICTGV